MKLLKYKFYILPTLTLFFGIIFFLSFWPDKNSEKGIKTAILNPKYENQIDSIVLSKNGKELKLFKENNIWKGSVSPSCDKESKDFSEKKEAVFPVEQKLVKNLIEKLKKVRILYKNSDRLTMLQPFSLDDSSSFLVSYSGKNCPSASIFFGKQDFSKTMIYMRMNEKPSVFKAEDDFSAFLNNDSGFWIDPYIIPRNITEPAKKIEIQKVSFISKGMRKNIIPNTEKAQASIEKFQELRHGSVYTEVLPQKFIGTLQIESDELSKFSMDFYERNEQDIVIFYNLDSFYYGTLVSNWTYSKILELFENS